jgi:hypothetical protein
MAEPPIRRTSIAAKLTLMNILVSGIGLLLAFVSFLAYDLYIYRQSSVRSLEGLAAMVGQSSIDAIGKGDRAEGQLLLSAFNESSNVLSAAVYAADGSRFAESSLAHIGRRESTSGSLRELRFMASKSVPSISMLSFEVRGSRRSALQSSRESSCCCAC